MRLGSLLLVLLCALPARAQDVLPVDTLRHVNAGGEMVYVSLDEGRQVAANEGWDLALQGTTIQARGQLQLVGTSFDRLEAAPTGGYADALPGGADGWYTYDMATHTVAPAPGRTLVIERADGSFAKVQILSYYHSATDEPRFYTFRYAVQPEPGERALRTHTATAR